jgi:FK506-binding protein 4/5
MSDDEEIPQPGMDGMGMEGDDDMSDDGDDYAPPAELPEGITKEILTRAPEDSWKKPKAGDDVTVHYVGTLQSDGSEFDSSRGRGDPFVFALGKGQVIKGWDLGVATMKKGELAKFTLAPEFAYGESGAPPKIPENATLVFEVELLSWASKDDLFGDEGVIKTQLTEGTGWKSPKTGDEVLVSVDGKPDVEYVVGSESLGPTGKACDKAITGMNGERKRSSDALRNMAMPL